MREEMRGWEEMGGWLRLEGVMGGMEGYGPCS